MHSELDIGDTDENLVADPSFENQTSSTISAPWVLESGEGGIDRNISSSRAGSNNVWLRNTSGWNAIKQSISVEANTEYKLFGFVKTSQSNNAGYFGVRGAAGNILKEMKFGRHDNYSKLSVQFNSGNNTSVTVFTGMWPNGDTWIQADDYMLLPVDNLDGDLTHKIVVSVTGQDYTVSNVSLQGINGSVLDELPKKGFITASADIRNNTRKASSVTFIVALYNKKGEIENLSGVTNEIASGAVERFTGGFKLPGDNSGYYMEVFIADSLVEMQPISNVAKLQ